MSLSKKQMLIKHHMFYEKKSLPIGHSQSQASKTQVTTKVSHGAKIVELMIYQFWMKKKHHCSKQTLANKYMVLKMRSLKGLENCASTNLHD